MRTRDPRGTLARSVASFRRSEIPSLEGRVALVTGANSGLGFEAARALAAHGAHVVLACRDPERGRQALTRIAREMNAAKLSLQRLDLASVAQIRETASRVMERHPRLDILCNNAGVMAIERALSSDGFELQLAVNHLGHFALTGLLLPSLLASECARVVTVTSLMHRVGSIHFDDLDGAQRYRRWDAYAQSKLANLLFAYELERRFERARVAAGSLACHPGYASTNLQLVAPEAEGRALSAAFFRVSNTLFAQPTARGAGPLLYAATSPHARGGDCIGPGGPGELWGAPTRVRTSSASHDEHLAARLWMVSVERTGVDYARLGALERPA